MGNKQTSKSVHYDPRKQQHQLKYQEYEQQQQQRDSIVYGNSKTQRPKRHLYNNNYQGPPPRETHHEMSRSTSSPLVTKPRLLNNNNNNSDTGQQPYQQQPVHLTPQYITPPKVNTRSSIAQSAVINANNELRAKQVDLTTAIKKLDSEPGQPSHLSSKLYKPSSLMLASSLSNQVKSGNVQAPNMKNSNIHQYNNQSNQPHLLNNGYNTLPVNTNPDVMKKAVAKGVGVGQFDQPPQSNLKSNMKNSKSNDGGLANKMGKKLGLSPKFKRKIVETIANRMNGGGQNNGKSRLLQALQSQWNIFTSIRMSRGKLNASDDENENNENENNENENNENDSSVGDDDEANYFKKRRHHTTNTSNQQDNGSTFLSISLERNSFRYASRRKYKTQSLVNPYRHADTNYPVYTHEALFMPEFSVKGQVTEADFEILDVISRGAFGHVIKVKMKKQPLLSSSSGHGSDTDSSETSSEQQIYAMKIMWKSQVIRDRALQQVKDEVTIAVSCVDNPLIVKTWFYWQSKRFLYIITDFIENGELLSLWLRVHHLPERVVAAYAVEMALALDYLHKRGIIYRDIKMENILLDKRGHVQLIDFGLSKWLPMGERTCTICGTIQYMAPEILSVEPYDHSVDWWSLGILVYALLSGEYPLNAAKDHIQMNEKVSRHIFELDHANDAYSGESRDLVRRLLRKNPQRRMKSLAECKKEPFFLKEISAFLTRDLIQKKRVTSVKERENLALLVNENFWNPYFIIENYSPLELLFEELSGGSGNNKENCIPVKQKTVKTNKNQQPPVSSTIADKKQTPSPPPPPPPPPPVLIDLTATPTIVSAPQPTPLNTLPVPRAANNKSASNSPIPPLPGSSSNTTGSNTGGRNSLESSLTTTSNEDSAASSALSRTTLSASHATSSSDEESGTGSRSSTSGEGDATAATADCGKQTEQMERINLKNLGSDSCGTSADSGTSHEVGAEGDNDDEDDDLLTDESDQNNSHNYMSDHLNYDYDEDVAGGAAEADGVVEDEQDVVDVIEIVDYEQEYKMRSSYLFQDKKTPTVVSGKTIHHHHHHHHYPPNSDDATATFTEF